MISEQKFENLLVRCIKRISDKHQGTQNAHIFESRLTQHFPELMHALYTVYGHRYDFPHYVEELIEKLFEGYLQRSTTLKALDEIRKKSPDWYQSENMLGFAAYVDLFAGDLKKLKSRIPYLQSLGVTYLHLMPLYAVPKGESDGGYAVSDYRTVNPDLGTMQDLSGLAEALREAGISLVLDFVFNHTADDHPWALRAKSGEPAYQDYYWMFDDKRIPDQYEVNLREIFPQVRRGNFTFDEQSQKWVWTTFNSFQWDLNYTNPAVFNAITGEMLFLANQGCEVLRLDALAFIWKEMGTSCENQENAHVLIQAFNACLRIAAPAVVFKSEAIVHPDEVAKYIDPKECELSYNPLLMALLWESLATRKTELLTESMRKSFAINSQCAWVNYVRCHDDVGWTFDDDVAAQCGINGHDHRDFLNQFYTGRFEGSFAKGVPFQENPSTGDCRVCGSAASLAGLEQGVTHAVERVLLVHSVTLSLGGVPLLYAGDELGLLNDYTYEDDPEKQHDSRWVHRIAHSNSAIQTAQNDNSPQGGIAAGLAKMIALRKANPVFGSGETHIICTDNPHIFSYSRTLNQVSVLVLCNFSERVQRLDALVLSHLPESTGIDLLTQTRVNGAGKKLALQPYQVMWIRS